MSVTDYLASEGDRAEAVANLLSAMPYYANLERVERGLLAGDPSYWCGYHANRETLDAVLDAFRDLATLGVFEKALVEGYTDGKGSNPNVTPGYWVEVLGHCERSRLKAAGNQPPTPGPYTLYRGVAGPRTHRHVRGLSWTTDLRVACWFAVQWDELEDPAVYSAVAEWEEVFFYTNDRCESEYVVRPATTKRMRLTVNQIKAYAAQELESRTVELNTRLAEAKLAREAAR